MNIEPAHEIGLPAKREPGFDHAVILAAALCGTPIAAVALQDRGRHHAKAALGISGREARHLEGLSARAADAGRLLVLTDLDGGCDDAIRFYAAAPIRGKGGQRIGTLCVADRVPREMDPIAESALLAIAGELGAQVACC